MEKKKKLLFSRLFFFFIFFIFHKSVVKTFLKWFINNCPDCIQSYFRTLVCKLFGVASFNFFLLFLKLDTIFRMLAIVDILGFSLFLSELKLYVFCL